MAHPRTAVRPDQQRSATRYGSSAAETPVPAGRLDHHGCPSPERMTAARRLSVLAALLIVAGGYVHFCLYRHGYRFIPKIGVSFLLQFTSSAVLAGGLLVKGHELRLGRRSVALGQLTRLSAIGLSVGTLAALGLAHTPGGLFQFHEIGLRPAPQSLIAIVVEALATVVLVVAMLEARPSVTRRGIPAAAMSRSHDAVRDAA
ncbi:MAG: hypothetical protein QOK39_2158 [Acidimicrobiaceae bacterium]|nr:hypothetical protein [Acidimicrobiaceae bacterium]